MTKTPPAWDENPMRAQRRKRQKSKNIREKSGAKRRLLNKLWQIIKEETKIFMQDV